MSYFVLCTFDLKDASRQDYQNAYADLEKVGLKRVVVSDKEMMSSYQLQPSPGLLTERVRHL